MTTAHPATLPWQLTVPAREALDQIIHDLTAKGWRPARTSNPQMRLTLLADPTATARLDLRTIRSSAETWHLDARLTGHLTPTPADPTTTPEWQADFSGPHLQADAVARAALAAPDISPEPDGVLDLAIREHGWTPDNDPHRHHYRSATSPDATRSLSYGPCDTFPTPATERPWSGQVTDPDNDASWALTATRGVPGRVLAAALLDTRPAYQIPACPQHQLCQLLTAHGFTAHLWQQLELPGTNDRHLADVYLRRTPGGGPLVAITAATGSAGIGPEIELAADTGAEPFGEGGDLDGMLCADCRTGADLGHATFTPDAPHQAILAYADALTRR